MGETKRPTGDEKGKKPVAKNSSIFVSRTIGKSSEQKPEDSTEEVLSVHQFETAPAEVSVNIALTMNLGNFESARISVGLNMPCYAEEIDDAYTFAQKWVEQRVSAEKEMINQYRNNGKKLNPL